MDKQTADSVTGSNGIGAPSPNPPTIKFPPKTSTSSTTRPSPMPGPGRMNVKLCELEQENVSLRAEVEKLKEWKAFVETFLTEHLGYPDMQPIIVAEVNPQQINGQTKIKSEPTETHQTIRKEPNTSINSSTAASSSYKTPQPQQTTAKAQKSEINQSKHLQLGTAATMSVPTRLPVKRKIDMEDQSQSRGNGEPANKKSKPKSEELKAMASALGLKPANNLVNLEDRNPSVSLTIPVKREGVTPSSSRPSGLESARERNPGNATSRSPEGNAEFEEDNDIDQTPCNICFSAVPEDTNKMLFCDTCNVCVHQACYGVKEIPDGDWKCQTCIKGIPNEQATCRLCTVKGGAMIRVNAPGKNSWAHVSCTWWIPEVKIRNPEEMDLVIGIPNIDKRRWNLKCYLCNEGKGVTCCIQCSYKKCVKAYHVTCAYKHGLTMDIIDEEGDDTPKFFSWCPSHSSDKYRGLPNSPRKSNS